jgi:hypothetical protein
LSGIGLNPYKNTTIHTGQGTASRIILFKNMYIELVWIENEQELEEYLAAGGEAIPVRETWKQTGISPFGVGLHYRTPDAEHLPIQTLIHQMEWMPEDSYIQAIP